MRVKLPASRGSAPWAIASFIGIPLFFSALMSSTLAQEKPRVVQWKGPHHLITMWHAPSSGTEARIWLWAMLPPVVLSFVGWICMRLPLGWYTRRRPDPEHRVDDGVEPVQRRRVGVAGARDGALAAALDDRARARVDPRHGCAVGAEALLLA
jgi:hypothetical protein